MIMNARTIMQPHLVNASSMADVLDTIQNVIMVTEGIRNHAKIAVSAYMRSGAELTPEQAQCVRDLSRAVDTSVSDGNVYVNLAVDRLKPEVIVVRVFHIQGQRVPILFRSEVRGSDLYIIGYSKAKPVPAHYHVGNLRRFRDVNELGVAVQRAAVHHYKKLLDPAHAEAAAETPSDADVQPGDSFRERALALFPSYRPASVSYGKHKLLVRSRHHTSDGHLMVFADNCPEYSLAFEMDYLHDKHEYLHGEYVVHVQLRHHNRFNSYDVRILATVPENRFSHCVTPAALLQRALSVEWEGKKVIDALLAAVATSAKHAQAATEPQSSNEKPETADFASWSRLLVRLGDTVRVKNHRLVITHHSNFTHDFLEICFSNTPYSLRYQETRPGGVIEVQLHKRRAPLHSTVSTIAKAGPGILRRCETRTEALTTLLGVRYKDRSVLDRVLSAIQKHQSEAAATSATEPLSSSEKPKTAYFGSWIRLFPQAVGTVRVQDVNLHVRYVNSAYSHLEVQYKRSPWALLFYSENDTEFRIRVMLNRKRFGHTLDSKTLITVPDQIIDGCETKEQVLKTVLGIRAQGKTVLQHLIDAASEPEKVDA